MQGDLPLRRWLTWSILPSPMSGQWPSSFGKCSQVLSIPSTRSYTCNFFSNFPGSDPYKSCIDNDEVEVAILGGLKLEKPADCPSLL